MLSEGERRWAQVELTKLAVKTLYAGFDVAQLEEILAIGRKYEVESKGDEVLCLNEALAAEIERRKAEARDQAKEAEC
jgi:hypothetical protein